MNKSGPVWCTLLLPFSGTAPVRSLLLPSQSWPLCAHFPSTPSQGPTLSAVSALTSHRALPPHALCCGCCHGAGVSRSVTVTVAYLMRTKCWTLKKALAHVKRIRHVANPNAGFLKQLEQYQEVLASERRKQSTA